MPFDLYPKSRLPFDPALFQNPTSEYRGTPFWAWNGTLDRDELLRQLDIFQEMGMGGAHLHVRTGLTSPYLGEHFMAMIKACVDHSRKRQMLVWLYDEDRWPSGSAGGIVTQNPQFRRKYVLFTKRPYGSVGKPFHPVDNSVSRSENGTLLARYAITMQDGWMVDCRRLKEGEQPGPGATEWFAYLETDLKRPWFNGQTYIDTLDPEAVRKFIDVTHEAYHAAVGEAFGKIIPAIFTDEPQYGKKSSLHSADAENDAILPFTRDFPNTYQATYGQCLDDVLPELVFDRKDAGSAQTRWRYFDHLTERFTRAFMDQLGDWCEDHDIALTGHMMSEISLGSQQAAVGEAMRGYRKMQLPGIDMLCDRPEYTTAKQCQSAVRQYGRCGMMSELYGVTNWDFPFVGHKGQGDWQAAMGVTVRVPHLAWMQMGGESKRDYPASIFFQSPWWKQYKSLEDHFSRVNVVLTRGKPIVRVAVIHPIESMWINAGPGAQNADTHRELEEQFAQLVDWLTTGLIDFDFISEALLPDQSPDAMDGKAVVGQMSYDLVIVPPIQTIRSTTIDWIKKLLSKNVRVLAAGANPHLVDGKKSDRWSTIATRATTCSFSRTQILKQSLTCSELTATHANGNPIHTLVYQLREEGDTRWLFIANTERRWGAQDVQLTLRGDWKPILMDTFTGGEQRLSANYHNDRTVISCDFEAAGHLLLRLESGQSTVPEKSPARWQTIGELPPPARITLDEPNVLLLDQAEYCINDGPWQRRDEMLRIQNHARKAFGLPPTDGYVVQPWAETEPLVELGTVALRFTIESEVDIASPILALEDANITTIELDGQGVSTKTSGWWVDPCLAKISLPAMSKGTHQLILRRPFHRKSTIEWCYLLGDFGVRVVGRSATLTPAVTHLQWGDITTQNLPFYTGNVTYHVHLPDTPGKFGIRIPHHAAMTLQLSHDQNISDAMVPPYRAIFNRKGDDLAITAFGSRFNTFGTLHHSNPHDKWIGPRAWRTTGDAWTYEYQLRKSGILAAPVIEGLL